MFPAKCRARSRTVLPVLLACILLPASAGSDEPGSGTTTLSFPDVALVDQKGNAVDIYEDLIKGKIVAIQFIFTNCPTICPPMGANFGKLQQRLGDHASRGINLISITVDPANDTPEVLAAWAAQLGAGPGWTQLTGAKRDVNTLLEAINSFSADITAHSPNILIGNDATGRWTRANGLAAPEEIQAVIESMIPEPEPEPESAPDPEPEAPKENQHAADDSTHPYFPDVLLTDQAGERHRFYSDLMKDRVVIINSFFATCQGVCPVLSRNLMAVQEWLGDRLGEEAYILSLTVDPEVDTPPKLAEYAARFEAEPGWFFLTGPKANVERAAYKLGHSVEQKEAHSNIIIVGNERTGLWKKVMGMAPSEDLIDAVRSVLEDQG